MKKYRLLLLFLSAVMLFSGCTKNPALENSGNGGSDNSDSATAVDVDFSATDEEMFSERDTEIEYDEEACRVIELNGDSATCDSASVLISGSVITVSGEGTYIVSGILNNGMIIVDAGENDKLQFVFKGASVTSATSAPFYVRTADKVFVTLAEGTENTLANGGSFTAIDENNIDAAVFSKQDITFNGTGTLKVVSPAGHGIVCKDDLVITGGSYTVNCASHGFDVNDSVRIAKANITIDAGKDGIHSENLDDAESGFVYISGGNVKIEAEGDGISAAVYAQIQNGTIDILAGGGSENGTAHSSGGYGGFMGGGRPGKDSFSEETEADDGTSMKGIKTVGSMLISDGNITIDSADDSIHANASVIINGGLFNLASGDDGVHADETLNVTAGEINISECYEGLEALNVAVSGGTIKLKASDDGINAAGGNDSSGMGGRDNGMFGGGRPGGMGGGMPGGMGGSSNGSIVISGGNIYINSSGDGIDANGSLEISGGYTVVVGPTQGDTATLDYDKSAVIKGGTFIGTGASGMAQSFSGSENQGVIAVRVGNRSAGTEVLLKDSDGNIIISHQPELSFAVVILSSPEIEKGEKYTIYVGSDSSECEAG